MKYLSPFPRIRRWLWASWVVPVLVVFTPARGGEEPIRLSEGHIDLRLNYEAGRSNLLEWVVSLDNASWESSVDGVLFVVPEVARLELPNDLPPLGALGDPSWILPQSQDPDLLFLGFSGAEIPPGVFVGPLEIRLVEMEGPGHFFLWQSELGVLDFFMNTRDGLDEGDVFLEGIGGHSHANWGFSTNGIYRLTFQVFGRRVGEATNIYSAPTVFTFHVEPVPELSFTRFAAWQEAHWPEVTDQDIVGPEGDPDGDGRRNLEEYALGTDPTVPDQPLLSQPRIEMRSSLAPPVPAVIRLDIMAERTDVEVSLYDSVLDLGGSWGPWGPPDSISEPFPTSLGSMRTVEWEAPLPLSPGVPIYYRIGFQLKSTL